MSPCDSFCPEARAMHGEPAGVAGGSPILSYRGLAVLGGLSVLGFGLPHAMGTYLGVLVLGALIVGLLLEYVPAVARAMPEINHALDGGGSKDPENPSRRLQAGGAAAFLGAGLLAIAGWTAWSPLLQLALAAAVGAFATKRSGLAQVVLLATAGRLAGHALFLGSSLGARVLVCAVGLLLDALSPAAKAKHLVRIIREATATVPANVPQDLHRMVDGVTSNEVAPLSEDLR